MLREQMGDDHFLRATSSRDSTRNGSGKSSSIKSHERVQAGTLSISSEDHKDAGDLPSTNPGNGGSSRKRQRSPSGHCQVQRRPLPPPFRSINVENDGEIASRDVPSSPLTQVVGGDTCGGDDGVEAGVEATFVAPDSVIFGRAAVVDDGGSGESDSDRSHRLAYLSSRGYLADAQLMNLLDASVYIDQENADDEGCGDGIVQELVFVPASELEVSPVELGDDMNRVHVGAAA